MLQTDNLIILFAPIYYNILLSCMHFWYFRFGCKKDNKEL